MSVISLIVPDNQMTIDGDYCHFDLGLAANIHAIQWNGSKGHIEYTDGTPNKDITDFPELESLIEKHKQAKLDIEKAESERLKKEAALMTYADKRKEEYNNLPQFEMIYDDKVNETNYWVEAIQAIKKTFPKPL